MAKLVIVDENVGPSRLADDHEPNWVRCTGGT
jgi:hypothetical protein